MTLPMKKMKAVIVEDEFTSIELLKNIIADFIPSLIVDESFDDPNKAASYLVRNMPDLLFVDIEMPGFNGLDLVRLLKPSKSCHVIFVTGHKDYAIEALKLGAKDYLLKPLTPGSVKQVVDNIIGSVAEEASIPSIGLENKMLIRKIDRVSVVDLNTVTYLEAEGAYTNVYFLNEEPMKSSKALGIYKKGLEGNPNFVEINRSILLNLHHVKDVIREGSRSSVLLNNGFQMDVSNRTAAGLVQIIEELMPKNF